MIAEAVTGLFALAGVGLGGWASHYLTAKRDRENRVALWNKETLGTIREKNEELYMHVSGWVEQFSLHRLGPSLQILQ